MLVRDIIAAIERVAPLDGAASWDKSGMQVACHRGEARRLAVALDPTPGTVERALELGCDFILTHHPLSLSPKLPAVEDAYHRVLSLLFRADCGLYAAHTSLDVQPDGPAGWVARELGLRHPVFLEETGEKRGFGLCGDLPRETDMGKLLDILGKRIDMSMAVATGPRRATFRRLAYCTGSGGSLVAAAEALGADIYVTGDVKYHTALDCGIAVLDVGHHSLEEAMMAEMRDLLARALPDLDVVFVPSSSPFYRP